MGENLQLTAQSGINRLAGTRRHQRIVPKVACGGLSHVLPGDRYPQTDPH